MQGYYDANGNWVAQVISHHLPLHRALARLLLLGLRQGVSPSELLPLSAAAAEALMEHPLRLQLLPLQLRLRWWVGNGRVPWAADRFYHSRLHRELGWAKDMLLLQVCADAVGPAAFLRRAMLRAGLIAPLDDAAVEKPEAVETPEDVAKVPGVTSVAATALRQSPEALSLVLGPAAGVADPVGGAAPAGSRDAVTQASDAEPARLEEGLSLALLLLKGWGQHEDAALRCALVHQLALGPFAHSVPRRPLDIGARSPRSAVITS